MLKAEYDKRWREEHRDYTNAYSLSYYHKHKDRIRKKPYRSNAYKRAYTLKVQYNLTVEQYLQMIADQQELCYICKQKPTGVLCVDHNHSTGQVRKLLCRTCNTLLGNIENKPDLVQKMFDYLQEHKEQD